MHSFKIGDFIRTNHTNPYRDHRGKITKIEFWGNKPSGDDIIYIEKMDGTSVLQSYNDYAYTFELDLARIRNEKIENLLKADIV